MKCVRGCVAMILYVAIMACSASVIQGNAVAADAKAPHAKRMRGAVPTPKAKIDAARKFKPLRGAPQQFLNLPKQLSMWGNATYGDCVSAEEAFKLACENPEVFIDDNTIIKWADSHGVLNGADLLDVIKMMQRDGISSNGHVYKDGTEQNVDYTNRSVLCAAIAQGPVKIGVAANQLEGVVGNNNGWIATGFRRDNSEDHCTSLCGYGTMSWLAQQFGVNLPASVDGNSFGYAFFTWSTVGIMDELSMLAITGEAWLRTPNTVYDGPTPTPTPTPNPNPPFNIPTWLQLVIQIALMVLSYFGGTQHNRIIKGVTGA